MRAGLALVPEHRRIFRDLTVGENLQLAGVTARPADRRRRLDEARQRFPVLADRWATPAGYLSGGEAQQLAVARALMSDPRIVLLDEPTLGLAPIMVDVVFDLLVDLRAAGPHGARRRAERPPGAGDRRPRLRAAHRPHRRRGPGPELAAHEDLFGHFVGGSQRPVTTFVQTLVDGIGRGSTYALLALGISLIFGVMHLVNFAHAELITVGAYVAYFLSDARRSGGGCSRRRSCVAAVVASVATERVVFRWVRDASPFTMLLDVVRPRAAVARAVGGLRVADEAVVRRPGLGVQHRRGRRHPPRGDGPRHDRRHRRRAGGDGVRVPAHAVRHLRAGRQRGLRRRPADGRAGQPGDLRRVRLRRAAGRRRRRADPDAQPERRADARRPTTSSRPSSRRSSAGSAASPAPSSAGSPSASPRSSCAATCPTGVWERLTDAVVFVLVAALFIVRPQGLFTVRTAERV